MSDLPEPVTRREQYLDAIADAFSARLINIVPLTISENGEYTAPPNTAYSPVAANVPNTYVAADEGKVVSNGALVSQTTHAEVTQNGTIDTTTNNSVTVNVPPNLPVLGSVNFITDTGKATGNLPSGIQLDSHNNRYLFKIAIQGYTAKSGERLQGVGFCISDTYKRDGQCVTFDHHGVCNFWIEIPSSTTFTLLDVNGFDESAELFEGTLTVYDMQSLQ